MDYTIKKSRPKIKFIPKKDNYLSFLVRILAPINNFELAKYNGVIDGMYLIRGYSHKYPNSHISYTFIRCKGIWYYYRSEAIPTEELYLRDFEFGQTLNFEKKEIAVLRERAKLLSKTGLRTLHLYYLWDSIYGIKVRLCNYVRKK